MSGPAGTGNTAPTLTAVAVILFIWALIAYLIRLYVKLYKSAGWGIDDGAITTSMLVYCSQLICICYAVHRGYGNPWQDLGEDDQRQIMVCLYANQIMYVIAIGASKASTGFFMKRMLARGTRSIRASVAFTALCGSWTFASTLAIALRGDMSKPWEKLGDTSSLWVRWLGIEASGLVVDVVGAGLVASFIYRLQLQTSKKVVVCAMLNCRLLLAIPVAFRLHYLDPSRVTMRGGPDDMITQSVISFAIIFTSVTCLRPFLRAFDQAAPGDPSAHSGFFKYTSRGTRGTANYELSTGVSGKHAGAIPKKSKVVEEDEIALNGDGQQLSLRYNDVGQTVHVTRSSRRGVGYGDGITKEQSWSVSVGPQY